MYVVVVVAVNRRPKRRLDRARVHHGAHEHKCVHNIMHSALQLGKVRQTRGGKKRSERNPIYYYASNLLGATIEEVVIYY
jgi:hypothetical protein